LHVLAVVKQKEIMYKIGRLSVVENKLSTDLSEPKCDVIKALREKSSETKGMKKVQVQLGSGPGQLTRALLLCPTMSAAYAALNFRARTAPKLI
jgi:hypothetical protein